MAGPVYDLGGKTVWVAGRAVGFTGEIVHDLAKSDGSPRKLMSVGKLRAMGRAVTIPLEDGSARIYRWVLGHAPQPPRYPEAAK